MEKKIHLYSKGLSDPSGCLLLSGQQHSSNLHLVQLFRSNFPLCLAMSIESETNKSTWQKMSSKIKVVILSYEDVLQNQKNLEVQKFAICYNWPLGLLITLSFWFYLTSITNKVAPACFLWNQNMSLVQKLFNGLAHPHALLPIRKEWPIILLDSCIDFTENWNTSCKC